MGEFFTSFSVDSLGDSTRSLLSPLYRSSPEPELSEGPLDETSDEEEKKEKGFDGLDERKVRERSKSDGSSSRHLKGSRSYDTTFCNDDSKISSRRSEALKSDRSSRAHSSRRSLSAWDSRRYEEDEDTTKSLSPWEEWLMRKTVQDREKAKAKKLQKKKEREVSQKQKREEEEKARKATEVREAWVSEKNKIEMGKRRKEREDMAMKRREKEEEQQLTELKSKENFIKWRHEKQEKLREASIREEENARMSKETEIERRLKNEQAFDEWLEKVRSRPKPVHGSFGYISGKLTGFYEWGSYPAPSYINPVPWVPPKLHKNRDRRKLKAQPQPPSPPLLFKELDQRMLQRKKGNLQHKEGQSRKS